MIDMWLFIKIFKIQARLKTKAKQIRAPDLFKDYTNTCSKL